MRAVIKFSKSEAVKYISHLDMLRLFQRALARSGLKVSYSEGYHPHMLLSFALATPVGVASVCEYAETYFEYPMFCEEIAQRLGSVMPGGCEVLEAFELSEQYPALMSVVSAADYQFFYRPENAEAVSQCLNEISSRPEIIIMKKSKKGFRPADIKPMLHEMKMWGNVLSCTLASGGQVNLRPDALDGLIFKETGLKAENIVRTAVYIEEKGMKICPEQSEARL